MVRILQRNSSLQQLILKRETLRVFIQYDRYFHETNVTNVYFHQGSNFQIRKIIVRL